MSDLYIYEAIDIVPPISESELQPGLDSGRYTKVTWEDTSRIGDGYFARVGTGMLGIAMLPRIDDSGVVHHDGVAIQADPAADDHRDTGLEDELRQILADFGTAADGSNRRFERAIYIQDDAREHKLTVVDGLPRRTSVQSDSHSSDHHEPEEARGMNTDERLRTLELTEYEVDLLRQMAALDLHDWKSGSVPTESTDPGFSARRIADVEALLAKLDKIRELGPARYSA